MAPLVRLQSLVLGDSWAAFCKVMGTTIIKRVREARARGLQMLRHSPPLSSRLPAAPDALRFGPHILGFLAGAGRRNAKALGH